VTTVTPVEQEKDYPSGDMDEDRDRDHRDPDFPSMDRPRLVG
jgi:hypothetical protein